MMPFEAPKIPTKRGFNAYSPEQDEKQQILSDIVYAAAYGFSGCRLPTPGVALTQDVITKRNREVYRAWEGESRRATGTRGLDPETDLSLNAQAYLAERLIPLPKTDSALQSPIFNGVEEGGRPQDNPFYPGAQPSTPPPPLMSPSIPYSPPQVLYPAETYYDDD